MSLSLKSTNISTDLKYPKSSFTSSMMDKMHSNSSSSTMKSFETKSKFFSLNGNRLSNLPICSINTSSSLLAKDFTSPRVPLSSLNLKCSLLDSLLNETNFFGHSLITEKKKSKILSDSNKSIKRKKIKNVEIESKKPKVKTDESEPKDQIEQHIFHMDAPAYSYEFEKVDVEKIKKFGFCGINIIKDWKVQKLSSDDHSLQKLKKDLLDAVSTCLVQPFNLQNLSHIESFTSKIEAVSQVDPEFVLKLALYSRKHLNIRKISNFLVASSSLNDHCKSYLIKYFSCTIVLPSDWLEVAEICLTLRANSGHKKCLTSNLRKMLKEKFIDFDVYQLAKYNKNKKKNKKKKVNEKRGYRKEDEEEEEEEEEAMGKNQPLTLKELIRVLHINRPVEPIMAIIGKKYPQTIEEFNQSNLPGFFDKKMAGKRMKLPIPETWETQIPLRGNTAQVWQDLIDHKKLPFMAMLRNIRNLLLSGISLRHHNLILHRLSNKESVINSKQLAFSFLNAFNVLDQLIKIKEDIEVEEKEKKSEPTKKVVGPTRTRSKSRNEKKDTPKLSARKIKQYKALHKPLVARYRESLNTAVVFSAMHNTTPIKGSSIIFLDFTDPKHADLKCDNKAYGSIKTVGSVSSLLGLMCEKACEVSRLVVLQNNAIRNFNASPQILKDVEKLNKILKKCVPDYKGIPDREIRSAINELIIQGQKVDNIIFFSNSEDSKLYNWLSELLIKYNKLTQYRTNNYKISVKKALRSHEDNFNDMWTCINGCSDQVLRFIAENGDSSQLKYIDNIDKVHNLTNTAYINKLQAMRQSLMRNNIQPVLPVSKTPRWTTCRVFISSTFLDMFSERDILVRYIFEELRRRGREVMIDVIEVDLRWGITEEQAKKNDTLELCLTEVLKSEFFVGMLGERYGREVEDYSGLENVEGLQWLPSYPVGASLTELEFQQCFQSIDFKRKAFFFLRDPAFIHTIPLEHRGQFVDRARKKLSSLKNKVRSSGAQVFDNYPCKWGGISQSGQPMVTELEEFGKRVLDCLWTSIIQSRKDHLKNIDSLEGSEMQSRHELNDSWMERLQRRFQGRKKLLNQCILAINQHYTGLLLLTGKPGSGKSTLMASMATVWNKEHRVHESRVVVHFVGAHRGSSDTVGLLRYLCAEVENDRNYTPPYHYKDLCKEFLQALTRHSSKDERRLIIFIDALDQLLEDVFWVPTVLPRNVLIVVSTTNDSRSHNFLRKQLSLVQAIELRSLEISDKMDLVRSVFKSHAKKLDERAFNNQMRTLVQKRDAISPLYLNLACEEVKKFGHFEKLSEKLFQLPGTLVKLVTERLEAAEEEHGKEFVRVVLFALHCSFDGLTVEQLSSVLNTWTSCGLNLENIESLATINANISLLLHKPCHPHLSNKVMVLLQSLRSLLKPACKEQGDKISLDKSVLEDIIAHKYTTSRLGDRVYKAMHLLLAHMYQTRADSQSDGSWCPPDHEALQLMPFHLLKAQAWQSWYNLMIDWKYLKSRLMAGQVYDVIQEFSLKDVDTTKKGLKEIINAEKFLACKTFLMKNCNILSKHPHLFMQQALLSNITIDPSSPNDPARNSHLFAPIDPSTSLPLRQYFKWINRDCFTDHCIYTIDSVEQVALCMSLSRDESLLAVGFDDDVVRIFCMQSFQMTKMLMGHTNDITVIIFIDNNRLLTASKDTTLSLWNVTDACRIAVMEKHTAPVSSCVSTLAGRLIVSVAFDGQVVLWHGVTGACEEVLYRALRPLNCVALDPEEKYIVTGDWSGDLRMFNMLERKNEGSFIGHKCSITCVAFDQSGDFMTSADILGQIRTWNVAMKETTTMFESSKEPINCLSVASRILYTASQDSLIQMFSATAGKCLSSVEGFEGDVPTKATCVALNSFPDDCDVITGYHNGFIKRHSLLLGNTKWTKNLSPTPIPITAITLFSFKEEKWLVVGKSDGEVARLDIDSGKQIMTFATEHASVTSLNFMHDHLITTSEEGSIFLFLLNKLALNAIKATADWHVWPHEGCVAGLVVSPFSDRYISVGHDMKLILWELPVKKLHVVENAHLDWITCCDLADNELEWNFLVTGSLDFGLKTWVINEDKLDHQNNLDGHMASISAVKCSKCQIVSASTNGEIRLWSYTGLLITTIHKSLQRINGLDLFPTQMHQHTCYKTYQYHGETLTHEEDLTGVFMVTCTDDGSTQLWKPFANDEKGTLIGHEGAVRCLEVGKQGLVCSGGEDKQVKVWRWSDSAKSTGNAVELLPLDASHFIVVLRNGELMLWREDKQGWVSNKTRVCNEQILAAVTVREFLILVSTTLRRLLLLRVVRVKEQHSVVVLWEKLISEEATSLSLSPSQSKEGSVVVSGHLSGIICTWIVKERSIVFNGEVDFKEEMPKGQPTVVVTSRFIGEELMLLGPQGFLTLHSLQLSSSRISLKKVFNWEMNEWGCCVEEGEGHLFVGDLAGKVWVFKTNKTEAEPALIFQAHSRKITCMLLVGRLLFTASEDKQIKVWCLNTNKQVGQLSCPLGLSCMKLLEGDQGCDEVNIACASKAASVFVFSWVC